MRTLLVLLAVFALAFAQVAPICTVDSHCNQWATRQVQRCEIPADPLNAVCQARTTFAYKTTTVDLKGMCTGSLNFGFGASQVCGGYSTAGCDIASGDAVYTRCIQSTMNAASTKCDALNATATTVQRNVGERCNALATIPEVCGRFLTCINSVCRPHLREGENCYGGVLPCRAGWTCDVDLCKPTRSLLEGSRCKVDAVCASGTCLVDRCVGDNYIPCTNNQDCAAQEVCWGGAGATTRGYCTNTIDIAVRKEQACIRGSCDGLQFNSVDCVACEKEIAMRVCAENCILREDRRFVTDGWTYDCTAGTRTKIAANTCNIKSVIANCPANPTWSYFS